MDQGLHWLIKTNAPKLVELVIKSKKRMIQDYLLTQIQNKHIGIKINLAV